MKRFLNKKYTVIVFVALVVSFMIGYYMYSNNDLKEETSAPDKVYNSDNYDKMRITYLDIKERKTGTPSFNSTSDYNGNDSSADDNYLRTLDTMSYILEVGIDRNTATTTETDNYYGGIIKVKITVPKDSTGKSYLSIIPDAWMNVIDYNYDLSQYIVYYNIPSEKSPIGGNQQLSVTFKANSLKHEIQEEFMPKFEVWMEGNKPDNIQSVADSKKVQDEGTLIITGKPNAYMYLIKGEINKKGVKNNVKGQYLNFAARSYTSVNKGYEVPKNVIASSITIEYFYKDIENGTQWINLSQEIDDPINGTILQAYGRTCESTPGFYPDSDSNKGYNSYCSYNSNSSVGTTSAYYYEYDSGTMTASQNGNVINFSNTDFYTYGFNYLTNVVDGFELFVPWYEPDPDGKYQYQVKVTLHGFTTQDSEGNDYSREYTDTQTFTFYNHMQGNFSNDFYSSTYRILEDTNLIPPGQLAYFYGYLYGEAGPYLGGLQKLVVWNSSIVDFVKTSDYPYIRYYDANESTSDNAVIYYGIYKNNTQNGVTTDDLVNQAVFDDFDWYSSYETAVTKGKVTAIKTDEPGWRGLGTESYISGIYLRASEDPDHLEQKGIIRQKIYVYSDAERTDVFEIGTNTDYVSSILKQNKGGLDRAAAPQGLGETYYIGTRMTNSISMYANKDSYNVEEETISISVYPYYSNPTPGLATSNFKVEVTIPVYLNYKTNSSNYNPTSIVQKSNGASVVTWEFNNWDLTKALPSIRFKLEMSPYSPNNVYRTVYADVSCDDVVTGSSRANDSFYIINLAGSSIRKTLEKSYLEINENTNINNYIYNIAQSRLINVKTIEILPKNGDSVGSSFNGTYTLKVLSLADTQKLYYTTNDIDDIGLVPDSYGKLHIQPVNLENNDMWNELHVGDIIPYNATAIASYIPEVSAISDIVYRYQFIPDGNDTADKYYFKLTASSDSLENAIATEYKKISVVDRIISGIVFFDLDRDDFYDEDYYIYNDNGEYEKTSDILLENKTVKLYNSRGELIRTTQTDENGYYEFKHLSKDEYYIQYDDLGENQVFVYKDSSSYYPSSVINPDTGKSDIITTLNTDYYDSDLIAQERNIGIKHKDVQVTVHHYIEETNIPVYDDVVINTYYTSNYKTSSIKTSELFDDYKNVYEFNNKTSGDSPSGTISKDSYEITYYYTRRPALVKVHHYIKGTNTKIVGDVITPYEFGIPYTTSRIDDPNYTFAGEDGDPTSGIVSKERTEVTYYYEPKPATITVHHYIEGTETKVHEDDILNRNYTETYTTSPYDTNDLLDDYKNLYEYNKTYSGITNGIVNQDSTEVIYYYDKIDAKLVIHHYAKDTTFKVHENETINLKLNDTYETHYKESSELFDTDYVYDSVSGDTTVVMDATKKEITYYYILKEGNITVHHVTDDTNEEMCPDETASGEYKTKYNYDSCTELTDINYTFKNIVTNDSNSTIDNDKISGRINQDNTEITYYYTYKPGQIVVHYFLEGTRERVADDTIADGKINEEYTSSAKELEGYRLVKEPEVNTITFKEDTQELIYEYERIKFKIEVIVVDGEGSITGAEEVFYGENEKNNVIITPGDNYEINTVTINGKEMTTLNIEGMTLSKFEGIKENILVEVKFVEKTQDIPLTGKTRNILLYVGSILFILAFSIFVIYDHKKRDYNS